MRLMNNEHPKNKECKPEMTHTKKTKDSCRLPHSSLDSIISNSKRARARSARSTPTRILLAFHNCTTLITFLAKHTQLDINALSWGHVNLATNDWYAAGAKGANARNGPPIGGGFSHFLIRYREMKKSSLPAQKKNNVFYKYATRLPTVHWKRVQLPYRVIVVIPQNAADFTGYSFMTFRTGDERTGTRKSASGS